MEARYDYRKMDERFSALKAGALFMKKRSEKNTIVFNLVKMHEKEVDFVVWIAPQCFLATEGYLRDVREAAGKQMSAVCFFAMENISLDDSKYLELYELASHYRIFCVVDESLNIKNAECGRTKRLMSMKSLFKFRLILSATPLTQGLIDLYSQTQFIDASILNMTQTQFLHKFLPFYMDDFEVLKRWSNPPEEAKLVKQIEPYLLACDFEDNLKISYYESNFKLTPREAESYKEEKEAFLAGRDRVAFLQVVQRFQYFYTICKNKVDALFKLVNEIIERKEKVIIYTKFLSEIRFFKEAGIFGKHPFVVMSGNTNKVTALNRFEKNIDIMVCTYKVESPRMYLKGCNNVIYFTQTFDYKDKIQTLTSFDNNDIVNVNVYDFWVDTRLENLIKENLHRKKNVLSNVCKMMTKNEALRL